MSYPKVQVKLTLPRTDINDTKDVMDINNIKLLLFILNGVLCSGHITACFNTPVAAGRVICG